MSAASHHRQWSIAKFECERTHLCEFLKGPIQAIEQGKRRILIRAPVKSGKRQMVEYLAMRDNTSHPTRKHKFLTQWHRKADEDQRAELKCYGIELLSGITDKKKDDYNNKIRDTLNSDPRVTLIVHIDECDHGSGVRQAMAQIWRTWREDERLIFILYSATPEEVIYSGEISEINGAGAAGAAGAENGDDAEMIEEFGEGVRFDYTPQSTFCGPARFIDAGLVFESRPFFEKAPSPVELPAGAPQLPPFFRLTAQGREIIAALRREVETGNSDRNILLIRLSYGDSDMAKPNAKENKAIYQFLKNIHMFPELVGCSIYVDKDEQPTGIDHTVVTSQKIQWSNPNSWRDLTTRRPMIIVYDQTFSRSTEYAGHDRTFATHDYRNQITFSISSQAVERMNHYSTRYSSGFQLIRIYCHSKTLLLSAGRISYEEFLYNEWEMKKVQQPGQRRRLMGNQQLQQQQPQQPPRLQPSMFRIQRTDNTNPHRIHPDHPNQMTEAEARAVLMELGCEKRPPKLSARVTGDIDDQVIIDSREVPCSSAAEFERLAQDGQLNGKGGQRPSPGRNPFESYAPNPEDLDRRFKSNIRGVRKVRTVDEVEHERWGISAIYHTRRHICYNEDGECVVLIQSFDGYREVDGLTTQGSMYRPRVLETTSSASSEGSISD